MRQYLTDFFFRGIKVNTKGGDMYRRKILVVDDEKDIVDLIAFNLEKEGFAVIKTFDGLKVSEMIRRHKPDLVVLDLMLPGIPGLEICRYLRTRQETEYLPVIILTAKGDDVDRVVGLELGADDYITKPFSVRELIARVKAVLRRSRSTRGTEPDLPFNFGGLSINYASYEVRVEGRKVELGAKEMKLLYFLSRHPGRVFSRGQLLEMVWGEETFVEPRTVDVHISRLRAAIEKDKENPEFILTVRGVGYKFADIEA